MSPRKSITSLAGGLVSGLLATAAPSLMPFAEDSTALDSPSLPSNGGRPPAESGLITASATSAVKGLHLEDMAYMRQIGIAYQGENSFSEYITTFPASSSSSANIWIGDNGPNTFTFRNVAPVPAILVVWETPSTPSGQGRSSGQMNLMRPKITYSLEPSSSRPTQDFADELRRSSNSRNVPENEDDASKVTISIDSGISGEWSALFGHETVLNSQGQIDETWGGFSTISESSGESWTSRVGLSYLNKEDNGRESRGMIVSVPSTGCFSDATRCSIHCKDLHTKSCAGDGSGDPLAGCGYHAGDENDEGISMAECRGWEADGHVDVMLGRI